MVLVDEVGVQLRIIETLFDSCRNLIKSSTSIDICPEIFVQQSMIYSNEIIQHGTILKNICASILSTIDKNRNNITITDPKQDKLIDRDLGKKYPKSFCRSMLVSFFFLISGCYTDKHKFTEEQLRYFVSVGPIQVTLDNYPRNEELFSSGKTCRFAAKWFKEYPYLEYSEKKMLHFVSLVVYFLTVILSYTFLISHVQIFSFHKDQVAKNNLMLGSPVVYLVGAK